MPANVALKDIVNIFTGNPQSFVAPYTWLLLRSTTPPADSTGIRLEAFDNFFISQINDSDNSYGYRITFQRDGLVILPKTLAVLETIKERGRATPLGEWTPYIPVWSSLGTVPVTGNATLTGKYTLIGKTCIAYGRLVIGSSSSLGTSVWTLSLPLPAAAGAVIAGNVQLEDIGTAAYIALAAMLGNAIYCQGAGFQGTPTTPFAWTAGDTFSFSATYEIA